MVHWSMRNYRRVADEVDICRGRDMVGLFRFLISLLVPFYSNAGYNSQTIPLLGLS